MDFSHIALTGTAIAGSIVTACAFAATKMPKPDGQPGVYNFLYVVVNAVAFNFGHAENAK